MPLIFNNLHLKSVPSLHQKAFVDVNGVRITPPFIEFKHAFEGRTYRQNLSIQNISKSKVFVTIAQPSSFAFKIECVNGKSLSPGLCLVRELKYVYTHVAATSCRIVIYINGTPFEYYITAKQCLPEISLSPESIDFGLMDSDTTSETRLLTIRNDGSKLARFFVDVKDVERKLLADPYKGAIHPRSSVTINLQIFSSKVGRFNDNIWIVCDKPYVVPISGEVIDTKFESVSDDPSMTASILIDFSATYVGTTKVRMAYVRNSSASQAFFCLMGEVISPCGKYYIQDLRSCQKMEDEFKYFDASPKDGICEPKELKIFQFRYKPTKPKRGEQLKPYNFCMYHVSKVKCKALTPLISEEDDIDEKSQSIRSSSTFDQIHGCFPSFFDHFSISSFNQYTKKPDKSSSVRIYLHGIPEQPSVTVTPNELNIFNMQLAQRETRILEFRNNSLKLPIIIGYKKIPFVDVEKDNFCINAGKSLQVRVFVTPQKIGSTNTKMHFDLIYYDYSTLEKTCKVIGKVTVPLVFHAKKTTEVPTPQINTGITPNYVKEVGKFCQGVKFHSQEPLPKGAIVDKKILSAAGSTLIAFPNDTQRSIRPWRGDMKITTIFTKVPRYLPPLDPDYELTVFGKKMKADVSNYYTSYLRKLKKISQLDDVPSGQYDLTKVAKLMCMDLHCSKRCALQPTEVTRKDHFIPLCPMQMNNIVISPAIVETGKIATYSRYNFQISIKNANPFAIRIYVKPDKRNVLLPSGNRKTINELSEVTLDLVYLAFTTGYYTTRLDIVVNECGLFEVVVLADVVSAYLTIDVDTLKFEEESARVLNVTNPMNREVKFKWSGQSKNFRMEPKQGLIKAYSKLACQILYLAKESGPLVSEPELLAAEQVTQRIKLCVNDGDLKMGFCCNLKFIDMPLNIPVHRNAILKNDSPLARTFSLADTDFLKYATVFPKCGIVYGHSYKVIRVTLKITSCVEFSTNLKFKVAGTKMIELALTGNVVYPQVSIVPGTLYFRKIPSGSIDTVKFLVENRSKAIATIKFDMRMYYEYKITESQYPWKEEPVEEVTLEKHSAKSFYIHFQPTAALNDKFFLPIIINDVLGPALDGCTGVKISDYLWEQIPDGVPVDVPDLLVVPTIQASSIAPKLQFSKLSVNLFFKVLPYAYRNTYELKITNNLGEDEAFCIRTDKLEHPFYISPIYGNEVIMHTKSMECHLGPKEQVTLRISFEPDKVGDYYVALPIFLRSDMSTEPHNFLYITGEFKPPTITIQNRISVCKPVPLKVRNSCTTVYHFDNHHTNCEISCSKQLSNIEVTITDCPSEIYNRRIVTVKLVCIFDKPVNEITDFYISCTCGASGDLQVFKCQENCFLTNYALVYTYIKEPCYNLQLKPIAAPSKMSLQHTPSLISILDVVQPLKDIYDHNDFFHDYPFFPSDDRNLNTFMCGCVGVVENWVYTQGFFGNSFYKIPAGISYVDFNTTKIVPPFIRLLLNLVGSDLEEYLGLRAAPSNDIGKVEYLCEVYKNALDFLKHLGAYFNHVRPEFLLDFTQYGIYLEHCPNKDSMTVSPVDREQFYRLGKQTWLDLLLQTYKVLVLNRLFFGEKKICVIPPIISVPHEKYTNSIKDISKNRHIFSNTELLLLNWLEFQYNDVRQTLWADNEYLQHKEISYYSDEMDDGFVYAAITLAYCPYLAQHFSDLYNRPSSYAEYLHNNIRVVQSWEILNFSLVVTAGDLIEPHPMRTLFIIVYLFQLLPNMYPLETINFRAGLSKDIRKTFVITNANEFTVAYKPILYGADSASFTVDNTSYVVPPKGKRRVVIRFWGRFTKPSKCTLILSGECKGYRYANSIVITLTGDTDVEYVTDTIELSQMIYTVQKRQIKVVSPYTRKAAYKIKFSYTPCSTAKDVDLLEYRDNFPKYAVTRILPTTSQVEFNEDGEGCVEMDVIFLIPKTLKVWLYFQNAEVGDFCVMLMTQGNGLYLDEKLKVFLPKLMSASTFCSKQERQLFLQMPTQNRAMWNAVIKVYLAVRRDDEDFWKLHSNTREGIHILKRIIRTYVSPFDFKLGRSAKYKFKVPKNCGVRFPKYLEINDDCSAEFIDIPIEVIDRNSIPVPLKIYLESSDGFECRHYSIFFIHDG